MKTDITILLDRSGSMASIANDTIGGYNTFLREQKKDFDTFLTLVQFDDVNPQEIVYEGVPAFVASELTSETFKPRGNTPLLDAFGKLLVRTSERKPEGKVIFVVITDGLENASKEYSRSQVFDLVSKQKKEGWEFIFLGANQDAIQEAQKYGIPMAAAATYGMSKMGETYSSLVSNITRQKSGKANTFTSQERTNMSDDE